MLLAALLYYMYKDQRGRPPEEPEAKRKEPRVVKARDYEAQVESERRVAGPAPEPRPEPKQESMREPEQRPGPEPAPEAEAEPPVGLENLGGIGEKYRALLEAAGVETLPALAAWDPKDLFEKLKKVNEGQLIVKRPPPLATVEDWVRRAGGRAG